MSFMMKISLTASASRCDSLVSLSHPAANFLIGCDESSTLFGPGHGYAQLVR